MNLLIRALIVIFLLGAAITIGIVGTDVLPLWLRGVAAMLGSTNEVAAKITIGVTCAFAGTIAALGSRGQIVALFCAGVFVFSGIADITAWFSVQNPGNIVRPIVQLFAGGIPLLLRIYSQPTTTRPIQHPGGIGALVAISFIIGAVIAANVSPPETSKAVNKGVRFVTRDFEPDDWPGVPIQETGLLEYLPSLGSLTKHGGPSVIAFYTPHCNVCHDFFDSYIPRSPDGQVIAVKIPPATGVEPADSNLPEDVNCSKCTRLSLPSGPIWLIQAPLVFGVVDGKVTCVAQHFQEEEMAECISEIMAIAKARNEEQIKAGQQPE